MASVVLVTVLLCHRGALAITAHLRHVMNGVLVGFLFKPVVGLLALSLSSWVSATGCKDWPTGDDLARHVEFVNRFGAVANVSFGSKANPMIVIDRSPKGRLLVNTLQRWRRNDYPEGRIAARDLVIFRAGKLDGTGILVTDYAAADDGRSYTIWLPSLRKIRRVSEPDPQESWSGSNFTFGDIYTRRAEDESVEVLGRDIFNDCLKVIDPDSLAGHRHVNSPPTADCRVKGRPVYRVSASPRDPAMAYDHRIIWIDTETFADYRSEYYRHGELIKTIDKSWHSMNLDDPRAQYWRYWYALSHITGQEGMAYASDDVIQWNTELPAELWSERTLRRITR